MQLQISLRDGPRNGQSVTEIGFRVEFIGTVTLVSESSLRHAPPTHLPSSKLRCNGDETLDSVTVVEQLLLLVMVVQEIVLHPDLHPLLPKGLIGFQTNFSTVVMREPLVKSQITLHGHMPPFKDF